MPDDEKSNLPNSNLQTYKDLPSADQADKSNSPQNQTGNIVHSQNQTIKNFFFQNQDKSHQITKWILFILLVTGMGLLSESLYEKFIPSIDQIEMHSQSHFVSRDLYEMYKKGQLPKYFFKLKNIKWSYYDDNLKNQIPENSIPFKTSASGTYNLEIDAFSSLQKESKITVLQMSLIEIESGNKIWELSRNYEIPNKE